MSTDEYVPSEGQIRAACYDVFSPAEFDRFLARVRRDAAREFVDRTLLDWGIGEGEDSDLGPATADDLRAAVDDVYPEETP